MENFTVKIINHAAMELAYAFSDNGEKAEMIRIRPSYRGSQAERSEEYNLELYAQPAFQMTAAGCNYGIQEGVNIGGSQIPHEVKLRHFTHSDEGAEFVYFHEELGLEITLHMEFIKGANVIRQYNTVKNIGHKNVVLTHFSSANISPIEPCGEHDWDYTGKFVIHYCLNTWQGEGQWRRITLEEAGIYACSVHQNTNTFRLSSTGSWSTSRFLPFVLLENTDTHEIWYVQTEYSSSWHFEIGHRKKAPGLRGEMYITAGGADENTAGWHKSLAPGESFDTVPAAYGCVRGGFEEAVWELTKYKRSRLKPSPAWDKEAPLFFNDYMNCLWADPTKDKLLPLIDAAAEAGAEGFCIDAGWFGILGRPWGGVLGDWEPSPDRFGPEGLQGIIDYIRSKGMRAGLWTEIEACGKNSALFKEDDSHFITRHGRRIGGERALLDFRNDSVRRYMHKIFDRLIDMGVTYFKNDYNQTTALGDDKYTDSASEGLIQHIGAVYSFFDELRMRHPGVIIEACAGGGMRCDAGMASHCHLVNTSDQEIYSRYPHIIQGILSAVLPEQATVWSYPWPLLILQGGNPDILSSKEYISEMSDGEQTVFNMVNGMCGNMLLSGRIDRADEYNKSLIKEGCEYYKSIRKYTHNALPFFPLGMLPMGRDGFAAFGLKSEESSKLYIALWRLNGENDSIEISLKKYMSRICCGEEEGTKYGHFRIKSACAAYPSAKGGVSVKLSENAESIKAVFTKKLQAVFIEVTLEAY